MELFLLSSRHSKVSFNLKQIFLAPLGAGAKQKNTEIHNTEIISSIGNTNSIDETH